MYTQDFPHKMTFLDFAVAVFWRMVIDGTVLKN